MAKKFLLKIILGVILMSSLTNASVLYKYEERDLSNGLKIVAIPMKNDSAVVDINIFYKVGSRNETLGKSGIAHMLEHMNFKTTKNLKNGEFDSIVKRFGGNNNASTGFDYTRYYIKAHRDNLDKSLFLFAEMMQNLSLLDEDFQTERKVVLEERLWRTDNSPMGQLYFRLFNTAYLYHPYHWTPIGFSEDIKNWKIEDIRAFHRSFYQPQNAIVLVAGDIEPSAVFEAATKHFAELKNSGEIPRIHTIEPTQDDRRFAEIKRPDLEVELVAIAYKIPNYSHADQVALSALSFILSDGKSSILHENLVNKQKLAQSIYGYAMDLIDEGVFLFMAMGNADVKAEKIEGAILAQLERVKAGAITQAELEKAKTNIYASFIYELQNSASVASLYGGYFARGGIAPLLAYEDNFAKLTLNDLTNVANKYFKHEQSTTIFLRK